MDFLVEPFPPAPLSAVVLSLVIALQDSDIGVQEDAMCGLLRMTAEERDLADKELVNDKSPIAISAHSLLKRIRS